MTGQDTEGEWREQWTVDGLEDSPWGRLARVELPSGHTRVLALSDLPEGVREGDVLDVRGGVGELRFTRLDEETRRRRTRAQAQLDALNRPQGTRVGDWSLSPDGEIEL